MYADSYEWKHGNKIVDKHETNLGLRDHMLSLGKWFEFFDAIIVLEGGEIVERGNHEELIAQKGRYYQLYTGKAELD